MSGLSLDAAHHLHYHPYSTSPSSSPSRLSPHHQARPHSVSPHRQVVTSQAAQHLIPQTSPHRLPNMLQVPGTGPQPPQPNNGLLNIPNHCQQGSVTGGSVNINVHPPPNTLHVLNHCNTVQQAHNQSPSSPGDRTSPSPSDSSNMHLGGNGASNSAQVGVRFSL